MSNPNNFSDTTAKHSKRVLDSMREAMKSVPKEHKQTVISQIYLSISKAHYGVKK